MIPAEYRTVTVNKAVEPAREVKVPIPAQFETVSKTVVVSPERLEWRSILCDTNLTKGKVKEIHGALQRAGYNPGQYNGTVTARMMDAVNGYQRAKGLPVDKFLNIDTVRALGVSPN